MTKAPIFPVNCEELFADPKLFLMSGEAQAMWLALLARMWINKAWIAADDHVVARTLGIDVRRWRHQYKPIFEPLLTRQIEPIIGDIYRQSHLTEVWESVQNRIAKNRKKMANARNVLHAQQGRKPSMVEPDRSPIIDPIFDAIIEPATGQHQDKKGPASEPSASAAQPGPAPTVNGVALRSGDLVPGSAPSDPALVKRLVSDGLRGRPKGTGTSLFERLGMKEDDDGRA